MNQELIKKAYFDFINANPEIKQALYIEAAQIGQKIGVDMAKEAGLTKKAGDVPWQAILSGLGGLGTGIALTKGYDYLTAPDAAAQAAAEEDAARKMYEQQLMRSYAYDPGIYGSYTY